MYDEPLKKGFDLHQDADWPKELQSELVRLLPTIWQAFCKLYPDFPKRSLVTLLLSENQTIRSLNKEWRGKDAPTNVLSFPNVSDFISLPNEPEVLGDIIIARETLEQEAEQLNISTLEHTTHLVIHGLLHLLDHDHQTTEEAENMEKWETEMMLALGFSAPYDIPPMKKQRTELVS